MPANDSCPRMPAAAADGHTQVSAIKGIITPGELNVRLQFYICKCKLRLLVAAGPGCSTAPERF
jgi:hypothetical protein